MSDESGRGIVFAMPVVPVVQDVVKVTVILSPEIIQRKMLVRVGLWV